MGRLSSSNLIRRGCDLVRQLGAAILIGLLMPGCMIIQTEVANPIPGLSTVAVAPFFNLSQEAATDGRRFATAYFAELQKTPGFQVLPVGVVEQAILDNGLNMNSAGDALKLAELLGVDAVVVGAVTDYDPYYPPRIGLQVSWYSPQEWMFYPGLPIDPDAHERWKKAGKSEKKFWSLPGGLGRQHQGQAAPGSAAPACAGLMSETAQFPETIPHSNRSTAASTVDFPHAPPLGDRSVAFDRVASASMIVRGQSADLPPLGVDMFPPFDPLTPLMSYTRIFDGADANLVAELRDYVELSGDRRSGGWEAYLHRSEDYIRFTAYLMIKEMLTLHGGEVKKRFVLKARKFR